MAKLKSNVSLTFGLLNCTVDVTNALESKKGNVTVCTGVTGKPAHDPLRIAYPKVCDTCGDVPYEDVRKAREVPEGLVLLTSEDIAEASVDATKYKTAMPVTPHPVDQVEVNTAPGEKAYYLEPAAGAGAAYAVLAEVIAAHPEYAFCTKWTPRTNMAVFRLRSDGTALLMQERIQGDRVKAAPEVPGGDPALHAQLVGMAEMVLAMPGIVSEFDLTAYANTTEDRIAEIVASRTAVPAPAAPGKGDEAAPVATVSAMDALAAMIATGQPLPSRKPAKKAAAKRAAKKVS